MFTILFMCLLFVVFGNLLSIAIRCAWGITKICFTIVFLPLILVGMVFAGALYIAFPVLCVIGFASLLKRV